MALTHRDDIQDDVTRCVLWLLVFRSIPMTR